MLVKLVQLGAQNVLKVIIVPTHKRLLNAQVVLSAPKVAATPTPNQLLVNILLTSIQPISFVSLEHTNQLLTKTFVLLAMLEANATLLVSLLLSHAIKDQTAHSPAQLFPNNATTVCILIPAML